MTARNPPVNSSQQTTQEQQSESVAFCATISFSDSEIFSPMEACAVNLEECLERVKVIETINSTRDLEKTIGPCKPVTELWCYDFKFAKNMERQTMCSLSKTYCEKNTALMSQITGFTTRCRRFVNH